jgi:PAS domain S-box-containing protein
LDSNLRYLRVNQRFSELTGKPASFFVGKTVHEVSPPSVAKTRKLFRRLVATGESIRDIEYLRDTGTTPGVERSWLAHWSPIKDAQGRVVAANIAFEESTERKRAEVERDQLVETLGAERRRLAALIEQMPAGLIIVDAKAGKVLLTNEEAARIIGQPLAETMPKVRNEEWKTMRPDGSRMPEKEFPIWRAINRGTVTTGAELMLYRPDGTLISLSVNAAPIRDAQGRIVAGAATFYDVSAQRETLRALRESEEKFRKIAENSPLGLGIYNTSGQILFLNRKLLQIIGWRLRDVPDLKTWFPKIYPDAQYRREVEETWSGDIRRVQRGELLHSPVREYRLTSRNGREKICEVTFALGQDLTYAVFNEVTERKRAEAEVLRLNEHLEERVAERTGQLDAANRELRREIGERLRLQSQLLDISEREQRRLGQDLHDELGQQLAGLGMMVAVLERELRREGHPRAEVVAEFGEMLRLAVTSTRDLVKGFYPVVLEQGGLLLALKDLAGRTEALTGVRFHVGHRPSFQHEEPAAIHLYRIAQEAVSNALKHAAPREIRIELTAHRGVSILRIVNDGKKFKAPKTNNRGFGLHIMEYRARLIGAEVQVRSGPEGGCEVSCALVGKRIE